MFLVCRDHVPMLAVALDSLRRCEPAVPRLLVAADSAESAAALRAVFRPESRDVSIVMWDEWLRLVPRGHQAFVDRYLASGRWAGFGKKLALLLSLNAQEDILYSDCDVLWYRSVLGEILERTSKNSAGFCIGSDCRASFDTALLEFLDFQFTQPTPMNTGFLGIQRGALVDALGHPRITRWEAYEGPFGCHTEQTVIACAADCVGAEVLPSDLVGVSLADFGRFKRQFTPGVRHYAGPKTLFWRDC